MQRSAGNTVAVPPVSSCSTRATHTAGSLHRYRSFTLVKFRKSSSHPVFSMSPFQHPGDASSKISRRSKEESRKGDEDDLENSSRARDEICRLDAVQEI